MCLHKPFSFSVLSTRYWMFKIGWEIWSFCKNDEIGSFTATYDYNSRYFTTIELWKTACIWCTMGTKGHSQPRCKDDRKKMYSWRRIFGVHNQVMIFNKIIRYNFYTYNILYIWYSIHIIYTFNICTYIRI